MESNKSVFFCFREKHEFLLPEYMVHQGYNAGDESLPPSAQKVRRTPYGQQDKHSAFTRDANPTVSEMSHTEPFFIIVIPKEDYNWNQPRNAFFPYNINYRIVLGCLHILNFTASVKPNEGWAGARLVPVKPYFGMTMTRS